MKTRRIFVSAMVLALLLILGIVVFSYRYLLLSKLNIQAGTNESSLGLRQVAEIPLPGSATRFDYQSIDDPGLQRLYVAAESGVVAVFQVNGSGLQKIGQAYLAPNAHTIAVDPQTHRVYVPLENINGHPVLRIYEPLQK